MFEEFSKRNRAISAAVTLAADRDWGDITLAAIAAQANLDLADLRREFACKDDILRAFQAEVDAEVLAKAKPAGGDDSFTGCMAVPGRIPRRFLSFGVLKSRRLCPNPYMIRK